MPSESESTHRLVEELEELHRTDAISELVVPMLSHASVCAFGGAVGLVQAGVTVQSALGFIQAGSPIVPALTDIERLAYGLGLLAIGLFFAAALLQRYADAE